MTTTKRRSPATTLLLLMATGLLVAIYLVPIWWVSLTAPNYPREVFPAGIRIHFHLNGVVSGCPQVENPEVQQVEAVDCVHEMDTINHYVGMYPIASGAVIELSFSLFILATLAVMILGFLFTRPAVRLTVMAVGFAFVAAWMALTWYGTGGLKYHSAGYIEGLARSLDEDTEQESQTGPLSSGEAIIARLKASLEGSKAEETATATAAEEQDPKARNIAHLRASFLRDQERLPPEERQAWRGSGAQVLSWHYGKSLARYFNNPAEIGPMVRKMTRAAHIVFWVLIALMALFLFGARRNKGVLYWLLVLLPMTLPVLFLIDYAAWLGWYGHTLNPMGAFTLKPFMPTVFGEGKVAQFTTHSYPHIGFGLMILFSICLALAALTRRRQAREQQG